jgi:PilZ domain-containing protein
MIERRRAPRHRVLKGATVAFDGIGIDCTVRNLSETGAALDFAGPISVPPSFMLTISSDRLVRRCHPVWSNDSRIGVAFDDADVAPNGARAA